MKIIAIGRNYVAHAHELNNEVPSEPVIFMKPETAILKDGKPFFYPEFTSDIHYELEIVLKISKQGKYIQEKFAHTYFEQIGLGIDLTARDLQTKLKNKGLPWETSKAFDNSAIIGNFIPKENLKNPEAIEFHLIQNGNTVQEGNSSLMLYNFNQIIAYTSQFFTLRTGDLIFTGTPAGVGPIKIGDKLTGFLEGQELLNCEIK
jgi:2-keto-4-pentenoate hydratase/2-oxohepta-3-ene-1,7-dioic acid hydratase in catechol pathway